MPLLDFEKLSAQKPPKFVFSDLEKALNESIALSTKNVKKCAVLFSGGVDSSFCAKLVAEKVSQTALFAVGLKDSHDLLQAKKSAELLKLSLEIVEIDSKKLLTIAKKVSKIIGSNDFFQLSIAIPEFIVLEKIKNSGYNIVFSGQGPDELFLGYAVFPKLLKEKGENAVRKEQKHLFDVFEQRNVQRETKLAEYFSLDVRMPFLSEEFALIALSIPVNENLNNSLRKNVFRKLALHYGLPVEIALLPKKAIQYGSGISKALKKTL
ncbi:MAG: asparagine synthase-related protein [archaeon]|nr:asparagine synthase-related protein [archaeon]